MRSNLFTRIITVELKSIEKVYESLSLPGDTELPVEQLRPTVAACNAVSFSTSLDQ